MSFWITFTSAPAHLSSAWTKDIKWWCNTTTNECVRLSPDNEKYLPMYILRISFLTGTSERMQEWWFNHFFRNKIWNMEEKKEMFYNILLNSLKCMNHYFCESLKYSPLKSCRYVKDLLLKNIISLLTKQKFQRSLKDN